MKETTDYLLYGLRLRSELKLPELPEASGAGQPDVTVQVGPVEMPETGDGRMRSTDLGAAFRIPGTASYAIRGGTTIFVQPHPGAAARNIRLFLLGSAMGMLVHQRGLLPLHANTLIVGRKAVSFMGHSGAGKSTLAAWFHDLGYTVLGDDVCVIRVGQGRGVTASAGLPRLRLWKNSLDATGRDRANYPLSYTGTEGYEKYDVTLKRRLNSLEEFELAAVYDLAEGERVNIQPLTGLRAAEAIIANTYRGEYVALAGNAREHWSASMRLVQRTPVFRLERPWDLSAGADIAAQIAAHAQGITDHFS